MLVPFGFNFIISFIFVAPDDLLHLSQQVCSLLSILNLLGFGLLTESISSYLKRIMSVDFFAHQRVVLLGFHVCVACFILGRNFS